MLTFFPLPRHSMRPSGAGFGRTLHDSSSPKIKRPVREEFTERGDLIKACTTAGLFAPRTGYALPRIDKPR
jgi:hypothetical protein